MRRYAYTAATALAFGTLFGVTAFAQQPSFKLCTGGEAGNYFKAGHILKSKLTGTKLEVRMWPALK